MYIDVDGVTLLRATPLIIFLLDVNFNKCTFGLNFLLILYMLKIFLNNLKLIPMSSIKYKNYNFLYLKLGIKDVFLDWIKIVYN